jgi:type IV secretory pathway VirB10-like protein
MAIDKKILSEIERYKSINKYIMEQDAPPPPPPPAPGGDLGAAAPPPPPAPTEPTPIDVETDDEVEKIDEKGKSEEDKGDSEELDVTDLVKSQENIETKQEEYFNNLFSPFILITIELSPKSIIFSLYSKILLLYLESINRFPKCKS